MDDANPTHISVDHLAERWAVHRMTVVRLIESGKLRAIKVGRAIRVAEVEVRRFEQEAGEQPGA
jgi:excisionase family DNA binding protein